MTENVTTTVTRRPGMSALQRTRTAEALLAVARYGLSVARPPRGATGRLAASGGAAAWDGSRWLGDAPGNINPRAGQPMAVIYFASPLAHLFEHGTAERATASGANRGRGPARPFLGPAGMAAEANAPSMLRDRLGQP